MSDAGNYCADCRFLHGAGAGYHAGSGGGGGSAAPPPLIRRVGCKQLADKGAGEVREHIYPAAIELGPPNHSRDGLLGPEFITAVGYRYIEATNTTTLVESRMVAYMDHSLNPKPQTLNFTSATSGSRPGT